MSEHDSQHPGSTVFHDRSKPRFTVRFKHSTPGALEKRVQFGNEENARGFFETLRNAAHPAEEFPVAFAELSVRVGSGPRSVLDHFAPPAEESGGVR